MQKMKEWAIMFLLCALFALCVNITFASTTVSVQSDAEENVNVVFHLINITDYQSIKNQNLISQSTIPEAIIDQAQTRINYSAANLSFNDSANSVIASFDLEGPGVLEATLDMDKMAKKFELETGWRKFNLNLTVVSYNFAEFLDEPVAEWQNQTDDEGRTCFVYSSNDTDLSFSFKLPPSAKNVQIAGNKETIIFEIPLSTGDNLLNSPFLILIAVIIGNIIAFLCRKTKKD
jgi:hypothetical protein